MLLLALPPFAPLAWPELHGHPLAALLMLSTIQLMLQQQIADPADHDQSYQPF